MKERGEAEEEVAGQLRVNVSRHDFVVRMLLLSLWIIIGVSKRCRW